MHLTNFMRPHAIASIIYIVYIRTNVLIYPIHIIYNFSLSKRERFFVLELVVGIGRREATPCRC